MVVSGPIFFQLLIFAFVARSKRQKYFLDRHDSLEDMNNRCAGLDKFLADTNYDQPGRKWDDLWTKNLAMQALHQVRKRVGEVPFRSFELNVIKSWSVKKISDELGLSPNEIYQHKDRLKKILRQEYQALITEIGE